MGGPINMVPKGRELSIHDHDIDLCVTMVGWVDVLDSDWDDFRHRHAVDMSSSDIVAVCESRVNDAILHSAIAIDGNQIYCKDWSNIISVGVFLYVKNEFAFTVCHDLMLQYFEALWRVLNADWKKLLIERFRNPTITETITVSEQPHVMSSLSIFVNTKPVESCFTKRVRLVQFLGE